LVALAAGLTVWLNRDLTSEQIAVRALSRTPDQLQFRLGRSERDPRLG